jgi:hypothetical protein
MYYFLMGLKRLMEMTRIIGLTPDELKLLNKALGFSFKENGGPGSGKSATELIEGLGRKHQASESV